MITYALLYIVFLFLYGLFFLPTQILPTAILPAEITDTISNVNTYLTAIEPLFPIATLLIILGTILTIEGFILLYKSIMWIRKILPF